MRYVYIIECADNTLYTGVTKHLEKRIQEHNEGTEGAAYTKARRPVQLKWSKVCEDRVHACREEYAIKQLRKSQKLALIGEGASSIEKKTEKKKKQHPSSKQ